MRWYIVLFIILFSVNVLGQESVTFNGAIPEITLTDGKGTDVIDLSTYFSSNNIVEYKYKAGEFEMEGLTVTIDPNGKVDMEASSKTTKSVIFLADDDLTVAGSNDVSVHVTGLVEVASFSPDVETLELTEGESQNFAVSGNVSVEWYADDILINDTGNSYNFIGEEVKIYNIRAVAGESAKTWLVSVLSEEIVAPIIPDPEPEVQGPVCGNGMRESGENCGNCALDVRCSSNSRCESGMCVPVKQTNLILYLGLLVGVIILAVVGVIFVRKNLLKKKFHQEGKTSQPVQQKPQQKKPEEKKPRGGILSKLMFWKKKEGSSSLSTQQTQQKKPVQPVQKKPVSQPISAQLLPLVNYFKTNLSKYKIMDLKQQAMKQGWTKEQINKVLAWIKKK
jgi:hypothetical protein